MRYSRTQEGPRYFSSAAVVIGEVIKIFVTLAVILHQNKYSWRSMGRDLLCDPLTAFKMTIPAGIYAIHNNILYYGLSNLEVPVYQVTNQLKIFSTAIFFTTLLKHKLPLQKWMSLFVLFVGISIVQIQGTSSGSTVDHNQNMYLGLVAVSTAALTSGFASVYFEKIAKGSSTPLWVLNFYLSVFGFIFSAVVTLVNDFHEIQELGFFYGWNFLVAVVVFNQALGGLVISVVVKFANTIIKGFISSLSIIFSTLFSVYFFWISNELVVCSRDVLCIFWNLSLPNSRSSRRNSRKKNNNLFVTKSNTPTITTTPKILFSPLPYVPHMLKPQETRRTCSSRSQKGLIDVRGPR